MNTVEFHVPDVGEGLGEVEIIAWRVAVGEAVTEDQILAEVQTDKSVVELPCPGPGTVRRLGGEVGEVLPVGAVLVVLEIGDFGDERAPPEQTPPEPAPAVQPGPAPVAVGGDALAEADESDAGPTGRRAGRAKASPAVRRLAVEQGMDLAALPGSGPGGRVTRADVEAAGAAPRPEAPREAPQTPSRPPRAVPAPSTPDEVVPLRGLRRRIATTMTQAWAVPHITEFREVPAAALVDAHRRLREHHGGRFTVLPLLVKAVVVALRAHPGFNARLDMEREEITYLRRYDIGVATATDDGLVVPVLRDAGGRSLFELADEIAVLAQAARDRTLGVDQTAAGTFTISNYGSFGSWMGTPIIRPPEAAIAGFGRIRDAVVAVDGQPVVRPTLPVAVSADHRLNDGHHLAAFLDTLSALLSDPVLLLGDAC